MSKPVVIGNWKMNTTVGEAVVLAKALKIDRALADSIDIAVCPPFISIVPVAGVLDGTGISIGSQDVYPEESGAVTGEISISMLKQTCDFVIVGHSERRTLFRETDRLVAKKSIAIMSAAIRPVVCVGESIETRDSGESEQFVVRQLRSSLDGVTGTAPIVVAYEPIWAIGSGRSARPEDVHRIAIVLRRALIDLFGDKFAGQTPIIYGGSVTSGNVAQFVQTQDIDGVLVGGASLDPAEFARIARLTRSIKLG